MSAENTTTVARNRIEEKFAELKSRNKAGLVTFLTAGDPDPDTAQSILNGLPEAGADIIELGMPFSDPMADGPAIQLANLRALDKGMTLKKTLDQVRTFRQLDDDTPIVLMGYYNPIHYYGSQKFIDDAIDAGVDGPIIVDLPPEEDDELCHPCLTSGLNWIRLATPTANDERLSVILKNSSGFVYYVSITGITGTHSGQQADIGQAVNRIKSKTNLPVAVGFGIKTAEQVAQIVKDADAAVVGSALVNKIAEGIDHQQSAEEIKSNLLSFVTELSSGTVRPG